MKDGFAELRSPRDLLAKMEHDRRRMSADPTDTYAAFDFFVTAEHMLDWSFPDSPGVNQGKTRQAERVKVDLPRKSGRVRDKNYAACSNCASYSAGGLSRV